MPKVLIREDRCKGCGLCVAACPKKILRLSDQKRNPKGFHPAEMADEQSCISCANCAIMCPDAVITVWKEAKNG